MSASYRHSYVSEGECGDLWAERQPDVSGMDHVTGGRAISEIVLKDFYAFGHGRLRRGGQLNFYLIICI